MPEYKIAPSVKIRKEPRGYTIYHPKSGAFWINDMAKIMIDLLQSGSDLDSAARIICDRYDVDQNRALADLEKLTKRLLQAKCMILLESN